MELLKSIRTCKEQKILDKPELRFHNTITQISIRIKNKNNKIKMMLLI